MSIPRTLAVAVALAAVGGCLAAPAANAAPKPGDACSNASTANGMWCDMQAGMWLSSGPSATVGQPCSTPGDVRLAGGENVARCAQVGSSQVWVAF
jgi:hypothetical protein